MNLYYENHLGERIQFYRSPYILASHDFFDWLLTFSTIGNRSSGYRYSAVERQFTVRIMPRRLGNDARLGVFSDLIDRFNNVVSADTDVPGKLWTDGGEYIECRIYSVSMGDWNISKNVTLSCKLRCDYPRWQRPSENTFLPVDEPVYEYLDFPYGFEYDYMARLNGYGSVTNTGTEPCNYILTVYGGQVNPSVWINGVKVGANVSIGNNEILTINTRDKTVIKTSHGTDTNVFDKRFKDDVSIFEALPVGESIILWNGLFKFDLTLLEERRSPRWN